MPIAKPTCKIWLSFRLAGVDSVVVSVVVVVVAATDATVKPDPHTARLVDM